MIWIVLAGVLAGMMTAGSSEAMNLSPWVQIGSPTAHKSVLDPVRNRLIMFEEGQSTVTVWAWSLANSKASTIHVQGGAPTGNIEYVAYDGATDRVIAAFGYPRGPRSYHALNLSGTPRWTSLNAGHASSYYSGFAFDTKRRRVLAMGGGSAGASYHSAHSTLSAVLLDGGPLQTITVGDPLPAGRSGHSMIYDSRRDRLIVYGGWTRPSDRLQVPSVLVGDIWELRLGEPLVWRQISNADPRAFHSAIYDSVGDRMIVFGGENAAGTTLEALWVLDFGSTGSFSTARKPSARYGHSAVYDAHGGRMIVHGGYPDQRGSNPLSDIWTLALDSGIWTDLSSGQVGPRKYDGTLLLDPVSGDPMYIINEYSRASERWRLGPDDRWSYQPLAPGPARYASGIADPVRGRCLFFGGQGASLSSELWELRDVWRRLVTEGEPDPRYFHSAVYDPIGERMIVYGGYGERANGGDDPPVLSSAWALSLRGTPEWSALPSLPGRAGHVAAYDTRRNRMIVFGGGRVRNSYFNETWTLSDREGWVQLRPTGVIPPAGAGAMSAAVYDSVRDEMVALASDGTVYRLALGAPHWTREQPPYLHGLFGGRAMIDAVHHRAIALGSNGDSGFQVWTLEMGCPSQGFEPAPLLDGVLGRPYRGRVANGAIPAGSLTLTAGALPPGLSWNANTGEITGVPSVTGSFAFTLSLATAKECAYESAFRLVIRPCLAPSVTAACVGAARPNNITFSITRRDSIPIRRWTARVEIPPGLALASSCDETSGCPAVRAGDFFAARPQSLHAAILLDGTLEVSGAADDPDCGARADRATLFTIGLRAVTPGAVGTLRVASAKLEPCAGPVAAVEACGVTEISGSPATGVLGLDAERIEREEAGTGLSALRLTFDVPTDGRRVEVYRAGFGNYPEYDDSVLATPVGTPPVAPAYPPGPPWVRTDVTSSPGVDVPPARDFWSYVAFAIDSCDNASIVSEVTVALPNYYLGDVAGTSGDCGGDGRVTVADLDLLAAGYGRELANPGPDPLACLDIGPTTTGTAQGRPLTDDRIDFEDLMVLALDAPSAQPGDRPLAGSNQVWFEVPPAPVVGETFVVVLRAGASGTLRAARLEVEYDASVLEWVAFASGEMFERQRGPARALSPRPGAIDLVVLGSNLEGTGEAARITFRLRREAPMGLALVTLEARGALNQPIDLGSGVTTQQAPAVAALTCFPNPSRESVSLKMSLPREGLVDLGIYDIQGRWVRSLAKGVEAAGQRVVLWDGRGEDGAVQPPGLYVARLVTESGTLVRRVALIP